MHFMFLSPKYYFKSWTQCHNEYNSCSQKYHLNIILMTVAFFFCYCLEICFKYESKIVIQIAGRLMINIL